MSVIYGCRGLFPYVPLTRNSRLRVLSPLCRLIQCDRILGSFHDKLPVFNGQRKLKIKSPYISSFPLPAGVHFHADGIFPPKLSSTSSPFVFSLIIQFFSSSFVWLNIHQNTHLLVFKHFLCLKFRCIRWFHVIWLQSV